MVIRLLKTIFIFDSQFLLRTNHMLQKVIDYQFKAIQHRTNNEVGGCRFEARMNRYGDWHLHHTIKNIFRNERYNLKWIGNDQNAHIMALFYCLVMGSIHSSKKGQESFVKVKYPFYQLSSEFLSHEEQKLFVENMCLFQHSKNIIEFLSKTHCLESLIVKIFQNYRYKVSSGTSLTEDKVQELRYYSAIFDFLSFEVLDPKLIKIGFQSLSFYIIEEKSCFFVCSNAREVKMTHFKQFSRASKSRQTSKKKHKKKISFDSHLSPISPQKKQQKLDEQKNCLGSENEQQWIEVFKQESDEQNHRLPQNLKNIRSQKKIKNQPRESLNPEKLKLILNQQRKQAIYQSLGTNEREKFKRVEPKKEEERRKAPKFLLQKKRLQKMTITQMNSPVASLESRSPKNKQMSSMYYRYRKY